ncbi:MazG nucleotide pyrophosphohydrolase domain-containing protein [Halobacterium zhouii]|uniref:MazG nucleotide pyrophosphohydrolase domain-containing protein n=1 Tax=Halobacterium zhouii TaxID=2902624 RepID=UPI001E659B25|nr:MazG nucleotide pyrophosphohydrolase domain-containing protein [Halobacterium zhouii]
MDEQDRVSAFLDEHNLHAPPAHRVLDLVSETGELAKDVNVATDYGENPGEATVQEDELGDALFCLLALADELDIDATGALDTALSKYDDRIEETDDAGSKD